MKVTSILLVALLLVTVATAANAATPPRLRVGWNSCNYVANQNFTGPAIYKLVAAAYQGDGVTEYNGHDTRFNIDAGPGPLPDAWRFDATGCNTGMVSFATTGLNKSCPAFKGTNELGITNYAFDPATNDGTIILANAYDAFIANPALVYTLYIVSFDHTYSVAGPSDPSVACGNADQGLTFTDYSCIFLERATGDTPEAGYNPGENKTCWQSCAPVVPAQTATWGRVKGLYR